MDKQEAIKLLESQQINPTRQRVDIAQLLFERPQHICAEEVIQKLDSISKGKISKATVYNTLNLFSQQGLVRELCVDSGKVYYDSKTGEHHHIYNVDTGELWNVELDTLPSMPSSSFPVGTQLHSIDVIYRVKDEPIRF